MSKPKLRLPKGYNNHNGWNWTLCRMLANSLIFDIEEVEFPYVRADGARNANWSLMELNGILIGLDTWDTFNPTSVFKNVGHFENTLGKVELILKIQYYPCNFWDEFQKDTAIVVKPWVVMPTKDFPLRSFNWQNKDHKWIGTVTGKNNRFGRQKWTDWCNEQDDFYSSGEYIVNDTLESYVERLQECKWGIILKGKRGAEKNRRECEFSSCGMPLALNYDPYYEFTMKAGVHYVKLDKPEDLASLRNIDPEPFAKASRQLYYDRFSPYGAAKTLLEIVEKL